MKLQGLRQSTNIEDRRNQGPVGKAMNYVTGFANAVQAGMRRSYQDLTNTGPYDPNNTLFKPDHTNHKLK